MIDISNRFKDIVSRNLKTNKSSSFSSSSSSSSILQSRHIKPLQERDVLFKASITILHNIDTLRDMLIENRDSYINVVRHTSSRGAAGGGGGGPGMTDSERDQVDRITIKQIEVCNNSINKMESLISDTFKYQQKAKQQQQQTQQQGTTNTSTTTTTTSIIGDLIRDDPSDIFSRNLDQFDCKTRLYFTITDQLRCYLSQVSNQFKKQRQLRMNIKIKESERYHHSLGSSTSSPLTNSFGDEGGISMTSGKVTTTTTTKNIQLPREVDGNQDEVEEEEEEEEEKDDGDIKRGSEIRNRSINRKNTPTISSSTTTTTTTTIGNNGLLLDSGLTNNNGDREDTDDIYIDEEDRLIYEQQNHLLLGELETLPDQILTINQRIEELSQLFDQITPHILAQREQIDSIYDTGVHSTNYITRGNDQIYQATKKTFDFRVMLLFFLIISSLSLLFLNWYQD